MPALDAPEGLYKLLGERLARLREERSVTQKELGVFAGLTRASIANIENGRQRVLLHQVYQFADFLHVRPTELLPDPTKVRNLGVMPAAAAAYLEKLRNYVIISTPHGRNKNRKRA